MWGFSLYVFLIAALLFIEKTIILNSGVEIVSLCILSDQIGVCVCVCVSVLYVLLFYISTFAPEPMSLIHHGITSL